jgi:hypothetical protein
MNIGLRSIEVPSASTMRFKVTSLQILHPFNPISLKSVEATRASIKIQVPIILLLTREEMEMSLDYRVNH